MSEPKDTNSESVKAQDSQSTEIEAITHRQLYALIPPEAFRPLSRRELMERLERGVKGCRYSFCYRDETHFLALQAAGKEWLEVDRPDTKEWRQKLSLDSIAVLLDYLGPWVLGDFDEKS
jgi:hypothetical protein